MLCDGTQEIPNLLDAFAAWNRCFTIREVGEWAADPVDSEQLRHSFSRDARFLRLSQPDLGSECFLPEREMFRWWAGLNLRLATIRQSRLTERQLATTMSSLRQEGTWFSPPADVLDYGRQFGFVADAWTPGFYVFPLAHVLSQLSTDLLPVFRSAFADFESPEIRNPARRQRASEAVESLLSQFDQRTSRIIKGRETLPPNQRRMTLEELGNVFGCTRERVRQIEMRFWKNHPTRKERPAFVTAFLAELMRRQGSLILDANQGETTSVRFLTKSLGVPYIDMPLGNAVALGTSEFNLPAPEQFSSIADQTDVQSTGKLLEAGGFAFLARADLGKIAAAVAQYNRNRLNKMERVYLTLRHIGKPAHFTEVAKAYNRFFPDEPMRERNVHAILSRCSDPDSERYGIVWIGVRGTYALKEHGYERPKRGLFDAVRQIVDEKYAETGKPVHVSVITAELGKYRQFVNPVSFAIATSANSRLERVSKDYFIPKDTQREVSPEDESDEPDGRLREFRADHGTNS